MGWFSKVTKKHVVHKFLEADPQRPELIKAKIKELIKDYKDTLQFYHYKIKFMF